MNSCPSHKRMYPSQAIAEDALVETRTHFEFAANNGPIAVYVCEDCGHYHLTSRGPMNEKLAAFIASGKINLQKEANHWTGKIKKR